MEYMHYSFNIQPYDNHHVQLIIILFSYNLYVNQNTTLRIQ